MSSPAKGSRTIIKISSWPSTSCLWKDIWVSEDTVDLSFQGTWLGSLRTSNGPEFKYLSMGFPLISNLPGTSPNTEQSFSYCIISAKLSLFIVTLLCLGGGGSRMSKYSPRIQPFSYLFMYHVKPWTGPRYWGKFICHCPLPATWKEQLDNKTAFPLWLTRRRGNSVCVLVRGAITIY